MKRITIMILAFALILSMFSGMSFSASAADSDPCYYGGDVIARIAQSYYKSGKTFYYNDGNLDFSGYGIDCSTYASLCLRGIPYVTSAYNGGSFHTNRIGFESGFENRQKDEQTTYTSSDKTIKYKNNSIATKVLSYKSNYFSIYSNYMSKGSLYYEYTLTDGTNMKKAYYLKDKNGNNVPFVREYGSYSNGSKYYIKRAADIANYYAKDSSNIVYANPNYYERSMSVSDGMLKNTDTKTGTYSSQTLDLSSIKPGDLIFWSSPTSNNTKIKQHTRFLGISHVAIVSVDGKHVYEAWNSSSAIRLTQLSDDKLSNIVLVIRPQFYKNIAMTKSQIETGALFSDMPPRGSYSYDAIVWAVTNGITTGTSLTTFSPKATCTRAQIVTFIWRAAGSPTPASGNLPFTDVKTNSYYYQAVKWAFGRGILSGTSPTTFSPDAVCNRAQILTFLWRFKGSPSVAGVNNPFVDVKSGSYYYNAVLWAYSHHITSGVNNTHFNPGGVCTREQVVVFLYRCCN